MSDIQEFDLSCQLPEEWMRYLSHETDRRKDRELNTRPMGRRLSTDCPIRRVKEFYDHLYRTPIHPGVAERGFEMESRFRAALPEMIVEWQPPIIWQGGVSAYDFIDNEGIPVDLKSVNKSGRPGPSTANKRQGERMLVAAGEQPGAKIRYYITNPGTLEARGPYEHELTQKRHAEVSIEIERVEAATAFWQALERPTESKKWNDSDHWFKKLGLSCRCGACLRHDAESAGTALDRLASQYQFVQQQERSVEWQKAELRYDIEEALRTRMRVRTKGERDFGKVECYIPSGTISLTESGRLTINLR